MDNNLTRHLVSHTGEKNWNCQACGKTFSRNDKLKRHIIVNHTNQGDPKKFPCSKCTKVFKSKESKFVHEKKHQDFFSYYCDVCTKGFNEKCYLKRHKVNKHGDSYEVFCEKCGQGVVDGRALKMQLQRR